MLQSSLCHSDNTAPVLIWFLLQCLPNVLGEGRIHYKYISMTQTWIMQNSGGGALSRTDTRAALWAIQTATGSTWLSENRTGAHIDANILDRYIKKNRNTSTSNELCSREQAAVVVSDSGGGGDLNWHLNVETWITKSPKSPWVWCSSTNGIWIADTGPL